ncbi:MAG: bifunctional phosphoribosylaminoimidazolecarboxamide formyltransferase/IMP cyclohydrolase, partial [Candidatus Latescibacteria bacterium]|nr:bifunctional phosphoribosylaminoimidazolecarboxamide formyltransferase/IMP cyclohydrolase [Candidatus Latescibacterota bacterium]
MSPIRIGRALLSVSDKTGLIDLANGLARHGVKIVSTGGTARALLDAGISVRDVSEITGYPELFGGRVKSLHPAIHGGILYRRGHPSDEEERHRHGIVSIEMVVVNLYPFEETVGRPGISDLEAIEQIDIGGPALIRAAAKNHAGVLVVVSPDQYAQVVEALERNRGTIPSEMAERYARRAFERTSEYDATIARYLGRADAASGAGTAGALPPRIEQRYRLVQELRYGENPGQKGALYAPESDGAIESLVQIRGKTLSYNNLLDVEAALSLLREFDETAAVVVKHRNPSGAALAPSAAEALLAAREADSLSAFGGILGLNRALDETALD